MLPFFVQKGYYSAPKQQTENGSRFVVKVRKGKIYYEIYY